MKKPFYLLILSAATIEVLHQMISYRKDLFRHTKYQKTYTLERRSNKCPITTVYYWIVIIPSCIGVGITVILNILKALDYSFNTDVIHLSGGQLMVIYLSVNGYMLLNFLIFSIISGLIDRFGGKNGQ